MGTWAASFVGLLEICAVQKIVPVALQGFGPHELPRLFGLFDLDDSAEVPRPCPGPRAVCFVFANVSCSFSC